MNRTIIFIREDCGKTTHEMAECMGVGHEEYLKYESGEREMSDDQWFQLTQIHKPYNEKKLGVLRAQIAEMEKPGSNLFKLLGFK